MRDAERHRARRPTGLLVVIMSALLVGVLSTVLSIVALVRQGDAAEQREAERIAADLAACERGNELRGQMVALGEASELLVVDVLDAVLEVVGVDGERRAVIDEALEPALTRHAERVDDIDETVDCAAVTPGTRPRQEGIDHD